jgi:type IV pilus assembly protein PilA
MTMGNLKALRNERGFTLVELMVVVAIIGVLAAIAIPQYNNFQAKARTSEARSSLGGIASLQQAFGVDNNGLYSNCLSSAGFSAPEGRRFYAVGIGATAAVTGCTTNYFPATASVSTTRGLTAAAAPTGFTGVTGPGTNWATNVGGANLTLAAVGWYAAGGIATGNNGFNCWVSGASTVAAASPNNYVAAQSPAGTIGTAAATTGGACNVF